MTELIHRTRYLARTERALDRSPIVALLGPRQCGKTTLAREIGKTRRCRFFDAERVEDQRRLANPEFSLGSESGLVVIDEIQMIPELFAALRVLVDRPDHNCRFLILCSASPELIRNVSESLAGRVEFVDLSGFDVEEIESRSWRTLWTRGGFPRSFLSGSEQDSFAWREGFIRTFLEHDIPQLGINIAAPAMRRFWTMLAHYHGQTWNAAKFAGSLGISDKTARSYLDILTQTFMVRQLQPWHENIGKRQVRSPKFYIRDSGLLHSLLGLQDEHAITGHPQVGASWEGFALEQTLLLLDSPEAYFWSTYGGAELDLLIFSNGRRYGLEFKFSEVPDKTKSMSIALETLHLERLLVVAPVGAGWRISDKIEVCSPGEVPGRLVVDPVH
ncbi:MAG: ATP-binding protein [Planctomycetes bacterium]|nr:ATP-binding protein [Planctomycetota bacterium]